jgi:prevent-host-death family protein
MAIEVGSYDAKTKLPELLREVQGGRRYTITLRGEPVADLVPSARGKLADPRAAIAAMRAFPRVRGVDAAAVDAWIAEGRR